MKTIGRMMMMTMLAAALFKGMPSLHAASAEEVMPAAILSFQERGVGARGMGAMAGDLLFAALAAQPNLLLVDRDDLAKSLDEQALSLSGLVTPREAVQVGQLTGAKVLITGSVIESDRTLHLVARIIGTETSRVFGESVKGSTTESFSDLVESLAEKISGTLAERGSELTVPKRETSDRVAAIMDRLGDTPRPVLHIAIEERHVGRNPIDPAAETEFVLLSRQTGFEVLDSEAGNPHDADILIQGEGFSEFAARRGTLVSVKARLEVKAIDRATGKVVAADRQTAVVVDLSEELAGKAALQDAAATLAERLLPQLVTP